MKMHNIIKTSSMALAMLVLTCAPSYGEVKRMPEVAGSVQERAPQGSLTAKLRSLFPGREFNTDAGTLQRDGSATRLAGSVSATASTRRQAPAFRSLEEPRGKLQGVCTSWLGATDYSDCFYGTIDLSTGNVGQMHQGMIYYGMSEQSTSTQTCAVRDGVLYIPDYHEDYVTSEITVFWNLIDLETGELIDTVDLTDQACSFVYALTYNPRKDKFYGIGIDMQAFSLGWFVEVDPTTWTVKKMGGMDSSGNFQAINLGGDSGNFMGNLAYCPLDGKLYGVKDDGGFYSVNPNSGVVAKVADLVENYDMVKPPMQSNPLVYSPLDKAFVTLYNNMLDATQVVFIDASMGYYDVVPGDYLKGSYRFCNLVCLDQYADDAAPAEPEIAAVTFTGAKLKGTVTFKAPDTTYNGLKLENRQVEIVATIDGEEVFAGAMDPGEEKTLDLTLAQGEHTLRVVGTLDGKEGPTASRTFYTGNDNPLPPTNVTYDDGLIFWTAPGAVGQHDGYVDTDILCYDVYLNGVKLNDKTLITNFYMIPDMSAIDFGKKEITVTATSNDMTSEPSLPCIEVFGRAMTLPMSFAPTASEASLFQILDANMDGDKFAYEPSKQAFVLFNNYWNSVDDWVFMPMANYPDASKLYQLTFKYCNAYENENTYQDLEVCLGLEPTPEAMTNKIYGHTHDNTVQPKETNVMFAVANSADYYIGFHTSGSGKGYRGIRLQDFAVAEMTDVSSEVPGDPTDVVFTSDPTGQLLVNLSLTLPAVDMGGNAIPADKTVTMQVEDQEGTVHTMSGHSGEALSQDIPVTTDGFTYFYLTPEIEGVGQGVRRQHRMFVGLDIPESPENLRCEISEDNMSVKLTWDAPTRGENGGYVEQSGITYRICYVSGITAIDLDQTTETTYTYPVPVETQRGYFFTIFADNSQGSSKSSEIVYQILGKPHEIPMIENFGASKFDYTPWAFNTTSGYASWLSASYPEVGKLNFKDNGGLNCYPGGLTKGMLYIPKVCTTGFSDVKVEFTFLDYDHAPQYEIMGRKYGSDEFVKLLDVEVNRPSAEEWHTWSGILPAEFQNEPWVQLAILCTFSGYTDEAACIDDITVKASVEYDLKVAALEGPVDVNMGETPAFSTTFMNAGSESLTSTLTVELLGDDKVLDKKETSYRRMTSGQSAINVSEFEMKQEYLACKQMAVRATIYNEKDEVAGNNSKTMEFRLHPDTRPQISDLEGRWSDDHAGAELTWSEPDTEYGSYDSFEGVYPFVSTEETLGQWLNYDGDKSPRFYIDGLRWAGDEDPGAWEAIDAVALNLMDDERLAPHSGTQYLMARCPSFDETGETSHDVPWAEDWLISPEVVGGTEVTFWLNTISSSYKETVQIFFSRTDRNVESFVKLRNFTKSGSEAWEQCSFTLPADAKYFAFKYYSNGNFGAMIDDVEMTLAQPSKHEIESYAVYSAANGSDFRLVADDVKATSYVHACNEADSRDYYVVPVIKDGSHKVEGLKSNVVSLIGVGIDGIRALSGVAGGKGEIIASGHAGRVMKVYTPDGKLFKSVTLAAETEHTAIDAGIYIVRIDKAVATIVVK